jgi:hypothetical protein
VGTLNSVVWVNRPKEAAGEPAIYLIGLRASVHPHWLGTSGSGIVAGLVLKW